MDGIYAMASTCLPISYIFICSQVMQRRGSYGGQESFNRDWNDYKYGFGDPNQEVWLGNENIHVLTNSEDYELRVELEDFEGNTR